MPKRLLLAALLTATSAPVFAQSAPSTLRPTVQATTPPTPEQAAQVIERLFGSMYGPGADTQLTYGAVPATLPLRLDPRLGVIASLRTSGNGGQFVQHRVLLSSALSAEQALAALTQSLAATGWKPLPNYGQPVGFVTGQTLRNAGFYREGETNFILNANLSGREGRTDLDLNLNPVGDQQIASIKKAPTSRPYSSLPLLKAFPEATVKGGSVVTTVNGALSSVHVQTERSANEVLAFYSAQLKAAGWKARTDTRDGPLRVVTYSLRDLNGREALGTLGIRPWEKEGGGYVLTVSVQGFKP
ncbi:hypothetical protein [Deinococcus budaensis]|uniref:Uncharacterized protein n=1 Tax=Deinococcus budaensis TaxID=1665626 RepID=A0A7W8GDM7_9DEIO|nr:hypothetical protein [Deinococcus budaensis]MBB5233665.1 hypothetical protein [Deinococcus budaensis]